MLARENGKEGTTKELKEWLADKDRDLEKHDGDVEWDGEEDEFRGDS
jgi:hypothetical protein